ncbi:single-stranded DNA-binding protein [Haliscomenobacter hydrossis]|uniref:single-stranded DNA-binding protein n=1 Tax=Haliscomenobacter hydrossis TaxID=2350 RepID=UPI0002ED907D|nr:single-stranded DNA-binding protein [Haliscomenobacter hydrossis]
MYPSIFLPFPGSGVIHNHLGTIRSTIWHDVLVFRAQAAHFAKDLKKGDAVEITGGIAYKAFKDEKGFTRRQASIIASYVEKIEYHKQGSLLGKEVDEAMDAVSE